VDATQLRGGKATQTVEPPSAAHHEHHRNARVAVIFCSLIAFMIVNSAGAVASVAWGLSEGTKREEIIWYTSIVAEFLGSTASFVVYGVMQEYIMTQVYSVDGDRFPSAVFLVFCNRALAVLVIPVILLIKRESFFTEGSKWCCIPAATLFTSTTCQFASLWYVSFPTQVVFKSGKIIPTMLVSTLFNGRAHPSKEYFKALAITACVIGFSLGMESADGPEHSTKLYGICLLILFLVCDALTSNGEKRIFNSFPDMTHTQMMFVMVLCQFVYCTVSLSFGTGFAGGFRFLVQYPVACAHVTILSIFSLLGQLFTFHIIKKHGAVMFSTMMTVRQMFSIAFSAFLFDHKMSVMSCICAGLIFLLILGDSASGFISKHQAQALQTKNKDGLSKATEDALTSPTQKARSI
jgi:drug/metabolite transporter (DMT)-like permease